MTEAGGEGRSNTVHLDSDEAVRDIWVDAHPCPRQLTTWPITAAARKDL